MDNKISAKGQLQTYLIAPLGLGLLWIVLIAIFFILQESSAVILTCIFFLAYAAIALFIYFRKKEKLLNELISFATQYGQVQKELLDKFVLPYALLDSDGLVLWMNQAFVELTGRDKKWHKSVAGIFPELTNEALPGKHDLTECGVKLGDSDFRAAMQKVSINAFLEDNAIVEASSDTYLIALYLFDETEVNQLIQEKEKNRHVCGMVALDNCEEALESVEEVRQSLLLALVERKVNRYFSEVGAVIRKIDKDRYFFVMNKGALEELKKTRFSLLDDVKTVNIGNSMALTVSMGISLNNGSFSEDAEASRMAIEMALGRGGDQVVVRDGESVTYYGGKTMSVEKNNRVKARVKAHALCEIMTNAEKIIVMGHKMSDIDALGAGIGIYRAGQTIDKTVHIVVNNPQLQIRNVIKEFHGNPDYDPHMFIDSKEALELVDDQTVVIMVDTNRPSYTECPELLTKVKTIVVIDHHRQSKEVVLNPVLNYVEPYASSACEMVAEILQYFSDGIKLKPIESNALYGGMVVDTDNFKTRTGVRTFEAAAFLRRNGADLNKVRKSFRESMDDFRMQARIVAATEIFESVFAISECPDEGTVSPTVVSSQAANSLLSVVGVKASFVLSHYEDQIYISARSIDEVNVQLIMERMGGGGHINIAGAQLKDVTMEEAKEELKKVILEMQQEGAI
jgi:cyclic-di-AMP phosphodiesterase